MTITIKEVNSKYKIDKDLFSLDGKGFTILVNGKRGSGKGWIINNILLKHKEILRSRFNEIIIIHPNFHNDDNYKTLKIQEDKVFTYFNMMLIEELHQYARDQYAKNNKHRILFIMDDILGAREINHNKNNPLNEMIYLSRNIGVSMLFVSQEFKGLNCGIRKNLDYVILFKNGNRLERENIEKEFNMIGDKKEWEAFINANLPLNHDFLLIDTINERIFNKEFKKIFDVKEKLNIGNEYNKNE